MSYHGFGWQHTFQFVSTGFSIYHGLPQEVFQLLVGEQLFSSAVLSSRAIAEGVLQLRYTASKLGACRLLFPREVEGVDTQPADIVIDMFNTSCIFYQDVAGIVVALGNAVLHQLLSVIVKSGRKASSAGGCRYWAAFGMPLWKQCCPG